MSRARENPLSARLFLAVLLLSGCPRNLDFGPGGRIEDPAALLTKVDANEATVSSLVGDGKLGLQSPQGQGEVALFAAIQRPNKLHLETFDFFNRPVAALVCDGERFGLYDGTTGRYYFGPATPRNLRRFLQTDLGPEQVVALMLGSAPRDLNAELSLSIDDKRGAYEVVLQSPTQPQRLWIDPLHLRAVRSEWAGEAPLVAEFKDLFRASSSMFPREIVVEAPRASLTLRLRYTEITLNKEPEEGMFVVEAPEGVPQIELDAEGNPVAQPPPEAPPNPTPQIPNP